MPDGSVFAPVPVAVNSAAVLGGAALVHVVPLDVSTLPDVPGATACSVEVPLPSRTLLAVNDVEPVPPFATAKAFVGVKDVAVNAPVLGLNCSLVDETLPVVMLPVVALVKVRYRVALVVVSSTMARPFAFGSHVGALAPLEVST